MKQQLIYTVGLPASGKTTWAVEYINSAPDRVIVSRDIIREMLVEKYSDFPFGTKMEALVTDIELNAIDRAIHRGYSVVVDATNFRMNHNIARKYEESYRIEDGIDIEVSIKDFTSVPLAVCVQRDKERSERGEKSVGEDVIISMYNRYLNPNR